jgi:hypothetical protein
LSSSFRSNARCANASCRLSSDEVVTFVPDALFTVADGVALATRTVVVRRNPPRPTDEQSLLIDANLNDQSSDASRIGIYRSPPFDRFVGVVCGERF